MLWGTAEWLKGACANCWPAHKPELMFPLPKCLCRCHRRRATPDWAWNGRRAAAEPALVDLSGVRYKLVIDTYTGSDDSGQKKGPTSPTPVQEGS